MSKVKERTIFVDDEPITFALTRVLGVQIEARIPFFQQGRQIVLERRGVAPDLVLSRDTLVPIKGGERFYTLYPALGG